MTKVVDLTVPIYGMWPNVMAGQPSSLPRPTLRVVHSYETHGSHLSELTINCHMGTHIDSPFHMVQNGKKLEEYPLERFFGEGVCLNIPRGELETITASDLESAEPEILENDIVLIHMGWGKFFTFNPPGWLGNQAEPGAYMNRRRPGLSKNAAEFLGKKKIKMLGTDTMAPQRGKDADAEVNEFDPKISIHYTLFEYDILIAESLTNLDQIVGKRVKVFFLPLNLKDAEAAPVRAIAIIE